MRILQQNDMVGKQMALTRQVIVQMVTIVTEGLVNNETFSFSSCSIIPLATVLVALCSVESDDLKKKK